MWTRRIDDEMLRTVVAKAAAYWSKIGIEAPHWSILSTDKFVPSQIEANRDMEMHATPQRAILALADQCGC